MKRIYHPTLNTFRDVPADAADSWKQAGWRFSNPGHVSASEGGVGDPQTVTDSFPFKPGDATIQPAAVAPTLVTESTSKGKQ